MNTRTSGPGSLSRAPFELAGVRDARFSSIWIAFGLLEASAGVADKSLKPHLVSDPEWRRGLQGLQ